MRSFRIGSVFGIPIELDLTFLIVLPVFAWIIGSRMSERVAILNRAFGADLAAQSLSTGATPWILGTVAAIGLFVGVVLHELGHSVTAIHYGYEIDSITLWIFGGIARFTEMPEDWRQELAIAVAGPIVSVVLGALSYLVFRGIPGEANALGFLFGYLGLINIALAAFNMLPGFPLDGGRVFRALLARNRPYAEATRLAANVGKGFALLLGLIGLVGFDLILIGIAFFVYIGAASEAQRTTMKAAFEGITTRDIMTHADDVDAVSPDTSVAALLERMFREAHTGYPVVTDGELVGLVTLEDARGIDESEREAYAVKDVMGGDVPTISADGDVMEAFREMQQGSSGLLVVVDDHGEFAGLISRTDVMTAFQVAQSGESIESERPDQTGGTRSIRSATEPAE